jgi:hypothetical protein
VRPDACSGSAVPGHPAYPRERVVPERPRRRASALLCSAGTVHSVGVSARPVPSHAGGLPRGLRRRRVAGRGAADCAD